ncbi:MAG: DNA polymerase III subunit chi [Rhodoferax sp.]|nr:DNA polymerase III subunit chi [Rhodoferax sp.]
MTDVAFHFNAPDRLAYACRFLRKAVGLGAKVLVTGSPGTLAQLDAALWSFSPVDFIPHCSLADDARLIEASPVIFSDSIQPSVHRQVLLNLADFVPEGFEEFARVIEIVDSDDEGRQLARNRWKFYTDRGYSITRHDLITASSST